MRHVLIDIVVALLAVGALSFIVWQMGDAEHVIRDALGLPPDHRR